MIFSNFLLSELVLEITQGTEDPYRVALVPFKGDKEIYQDFTRKDTIFDFEINDLAPVNYIAETLTYGELNKFISEEKQRGSSLINNHLLIRHKRWSIPISSFIFLPANITLGMYPCCLETWVK